MITTKQQLIDFFVLRNNIGIKPGLKRVNYLLQMAGNPEKKIQAVHVAGTNGKGSVIQFMQQALVENGYHVGVFTSPSFIGLKGHFLLDGYPVKESEVIDHVNAMIPAIRQLDQEGDAPTAFEILTVVAFTCFCGKVDIALIETGMGGRFDTTNCFHPLVTVITTVARDHMQHLGHTVEEIAYHKAGIIKYNTPVVTGRLDLDADRVIRQEAVENHAQLYQLGIDFSNEHGMYSWETEEISRLLPVLELIGLHQLDNVALAFSTLHLLEKSGFILTKEKVFRAFENTTLPGRYEQISVKPFIILDSAHNTAGTRAFLETMKRNDDTADKRLLFAGFQDKELGKMLDLLVPHFQLVTVTSFSHERAAPISAYNLYSSQVETEDDWQHALDDMLSDPSRDVHYYITGSLHFITKVRAYLLKNKR